MTKWYVVSTASLTEKCIKFRTDQQESLKQMEKLNNLFLKAMSGVPFVYFTYAGRGSNKEKVVLLFKSIHDPECSPCIFISTKYAPQAICIGVETFRQTGQSSCKLSGFLMQEHTPQGP